MKLEISRSVFKKHSYTYIKKFTKLPTVGAESFNADGRTDRHEELVVSFRNFVKVPKNFILLI